MSHAEVGAGRAWAAEDFGAAGFVFEWNAVNQTGRSEIFEVASIVPVPRKVAQGWLRWAANFGGEARV
jgi:hypothetical protein